MSTTNESTGSDDEKKGNRCPSLSDRSIKTRARGWLSAPQVAKRLGYSRSRIHQLIQAGKIPAHRLGPKGDWRIAASWVQEQLAGGYSSGPREG